MQVVFPNPRLCCCPGDDGLLVYDPVTDRIHRLNPLASLIAALCDGQRPVAEIARLVAPLIPEGGEDQAHRCIEQGIAAGLFTTAPTRARGDDPGRLAERLKAEAKLEAACICQFAAAEREPGEPSHWAALGELAHVLGRRSLALSAYERYSALRPEDAEVRHLLVALRDEPPPARASDACIQQLYARFSAFYDTNMLDELEYQAPVRIAALVDRCMGERSGLVALDLGCGSGLAGAQIRARCARLTGVDLSPEMLELARARGVYDRLERAEIGSWLAGCDQDFDLILACDSLVYFGELRPVILPAARRLRHGGWLVFTLELGDLIPFKLNDHGRYSHHPDEVRALAADAGLRVAQLEQGVLRLEYGTEVQGLLVALARQDSTV